jgi:integrase
LATIFRVESGNWRVQVRRKGRYISETFRRHKDAEEWALDTERRIDRGEAPRTSSFSDPTTFGHLIDLHFADMKEVGKCHQRSKVFSLESLQKRLGKIRIADLNRERLVTFGRDRAREGAGPVTIGADLGYVKTIIAHAAAVHGIAISVEPVVLARIALKRLGLIGKSKSRERRPTQDELDRLFDFLDQSQRLSIPVARIARFAIATAMRQDEICRLLWQDVDAATRTAIIRDRKDPREKSGNHQKVPLLHLTGFDAWLLLEEQANISGRGDRVFPYNGRSVGTAFHRACRELGIADLHFHDLRHEAASRLFEAGLTIQQVALVTGHRDWKILKRYTHLRPEDLHKVLGQAPLVRHSDRVESAPKVAQLLNPAIPSSTSLAPIIRDRKSAR